MFVGVGVGVGALVGVGVMSIVMIVTLLLDNRYCISPSGYPSLHVIIYDETVRFIVFPVIPLKTFSLSTLSPKDKIDGIYNSVIDVQLSKPLLPIEIKFGRLKFVILLQE